jgi:hypothetical protein
MPSPWAAELLWLARQPRDVARAYLAAVMRWCTPPAGWARQARARIEG